MSLKYIPPNAPFLITSAGVLFAPKSFIKHLYLLTQNYSALLRVSSLLIPHKIHPAPTPFTFNIAMFLTHKQSSVHHEIYYRYVAEI